MKVATFTEKSITFCILEYNFTSRVVLLLHSYLLLVHLIDSMDTSVTYFTEFTSLVSLLLSTQNERNLKYLDFSNSIEIE
jgi:hypothetical protein